MYFTGEETELVHEVSNVLLEENSISATFEAFNQKTIGRTQKKFGE